MLQGEIGKQQIDGEPARAHCLSEACLQKILGSGVGGRQNSMRIGAGVAAKAASVTTRIVTALL